MIKKIIAGVIVFGLIYFFVLPWVGRILTLLIAFGAVVLLFSILKGIGGKSNGGSSV